ncbi:MAG: hypothetical protein ACC657_12290 [Thiohalomonadales bacterium]
MLIINYKSKLFFKLIVLIFLSSIFFSTISTAENNSLPSYPTKLGPKTFDQATIKSFKNNYKNSIIYAFSGNEKFHSSRLQRSYFTNNLEIFYGDLYIGNYTNSEISYKLYFFLDYQQHSFSLSKKKSKNLMVYKFSVKSKSEKILPLRFGKITEGAHDILIVAICDEAMNTYNHPKIISHRANLYVKHGKFENIEYKELTNSEKKVMTDIIITKNIKYNNSKKDLIKSNKYNYLIHVSNFYNTKLKYSLIVMLNSKQVFINNNKRIIYFEQEEFSTNIIPIEINTKNKKISTNDKLFAIVTDNPYSVLEPVRGVYSKINANIRISNNILN